MDFSHMVTFTANVPVITKANKLTSGAQHTRGFGGDAGDGTDGSRMAGARNCKGEYLAPATTKLGTCLSLPSSTERYSSQTVNDAERMMDHGIATLIASTYRTRTECPLL